MAATAHGGLTANTVKSVLVECGRNGIVVVNRAQRGVIWVRIDGVDPVPETPGTYAVLGAREFDLTRSDTYYPLDVRMVADTELTYTVEAY
jgi:hypothetical protein